MRQLTLFRQLTPVGFGTNAPTDILTDGSSILEIGNSLQLPTNTIEIVATDAYISNGFVDLRARSGAPGNEENETWDSLALSAKAGGFTSVFILPQLIPVVDNAEMVQAVVNAGKQTSSHFQAIGSISKANDGVHLSNMMEMAQVGAKLFAEADAIYNADLLLKALQYGQMIDATIIDRPEEKSTALYGQIHEGVMSNSLGLKGIPTLSEVLAVQRDIEILRYAGGKLHLSCISTKEALELIAQAKNDGLSITCDVAAHQLVFIDEALSSFDSNLKVKPPFRTETDRQALIEGIKTGVIDAIVSDHTPCSIDTKELEFDGASFGISSLPLVFHQALKALGNNPDLLAKVLSHNPAKIGSAKLQKLEKGSSNFTIFSTARNTVYHPASWPSLSKNQPLLGQTLQGEIIATIA